MINTEFVLAWRFEVPLLGKIFYWSILGQYDLTVPDTSEMNEELLVITLGNILTTFWAFRPVSTYDKRICHISSVACHHAPQKRRRKSYSALEREIEESCCGYWVFVLVIFWRYVLVWMSWNMREFTYASCRQLQFFLGSSRFHDESHVKCVGVWRKTEIGCAGVAKQN